MSCDTDNVAFTKNNKYVALITFAVSIESIMWHWLTLLLDYKVSCDTDYLCSYYRKYHVALIIFALRL